MYSGQAVTGLPEDAAGLLEKAGHARPNGFIADTDFDANSTAISIS
jgi:hypothetical protein